MLTDCPDPKEVSDFHFRQLRTLRLLKENEQIPARCVNLLTCASKYDLLFIGVQGGFKILKLEDVLTLDEDRENRSILEKYPFSFVSCDTPSLLAVNATQTVLAVCTKSAAATVLLFYSLANFPGFDSPWQPFCTQGFSSQNSELKDFAWNPALEGLYSFCLSDGSLHIHEIVGTAIKPNATLSNAKALTVCWSPKGKQLVVGKSDGSFSQCKPTLDVVNTVMPPALEDGPVSVTSICWISTTVFAVVYATIENPAPSLFIVSTPKGQPITYVNFNDLCLGNNSAEDQKYLMHLEPSWGLLICSSFDSIEIAVLGDMPNWVQWDLREDGKALLPGKNGASSAVGMTVIYSAQKQIIISDSVSYPPMPILFVLTNNGLLVSFHMVNEKSGAPALVSAPVPTEFKMCSANGLPVTNASSRTNEISEKKSSMPQAPSLMSSTPIIGKSVPSVQILPSMNVSQNATFGMEPKSAFAPPSNLNMNALSSSGNQTFTINLNKTEPVRASSTLDNEKQGRLQMTPPSFTSGKENEVLSNTENSFRTAIISEIQSFEKELQDLKQLQSSLPTVSVEEDMTSLKVFAMNLENFQKDITETMQSLSSDIYTLKNVLLESFVLFEEASSRERRRNDHSYITMLKERALDPITARRMQKMNQLFQYLSTQLQEVNNKLDQEWILHMSNKEKMLRNNLSISSTEAIYKTIVNNQKIIHNFRKKVDLLMKKAEEKRLRNITNSGSWARHHKRSPQEDLSKLADEFLQVKINHKEEGDSSQTKKLSAESQNFLKDFLKKSNIVTVRPTAVYSLSQSRLLSSAATFDDSSGSDQTQDVSPKIVSVTSEKDMTKKPLPMLEDLNTSSILNQHKESTPVKPYLPVYEPITPPDTTPEPVIKSVTSLSRESKPEPSSHPSSISVTVNLDQGVRSTQLSGGKSNKEFPKFSFGTEMKSPLFNQAISEAFTSTSTVFSKPFSFAPSIQKDPETTISKSLATNNNSSSLPTAGFQLGQKRDAFWSVSSTIAPSTSASTLNSVTSNNQKLVQQDKPFENSSNSIIIVSASSVPPVSKAIVSTSLAVTAEKKLPQTAQDNANISANQPLKSTGNAGFLKGFSNKTEQQTKKNDSFANSGFLSGAGLSFSFSSPNKTVSATNHTPSSQGQSILVDSFKSANKTENFNIPSPQTEASVVLKTDNTTVANNELKIINVNLSELKQPLSSFNLSEQSVLPDTSSEPVNLSLSTPVVESVVSTAPSLTITAVSSATSTETVTSQSGEPISKPPSPPLTADQTSTSPSILVLQTASTTSSDVSATSLSQVIGQPQSETPSLFSSPKTDVSTSNETSTTQTLLGQQSVSTAVTQVTSFGKPPSSSAPQTTLFGQPPSTTATQPSLFGQTPSTTTTQPSLFGQPLSTTATQPSLFGQPTAATTTQPSLFGQPPSTTPAKPTLFGQPAAATVTQAPVFGQPTTTSSFSSTAGGFFSQTAFGAPSATTAVTSANSDFSNQSSTFSFGKPAFGQTTGSFGLAKSFFGQNTTPATQASTPSSFSFGQNSGSTFGQGSFFSGLGGKPSEENANKNVFGIGSSIKSSDTNNLFKNSSVKSFGAVNANSFSGTGSFSSGGASVAQTGFGAFQQSQAQQPGGFGAAPTFGGGPAFGSTSAFGSPPAFGSAPVFGQQQQPQQVSSNFSNFANASSPTFGSLASQSTGFGSSPGFGSPPAFGSAPAFGSPPPAFGGQSPGFGSPGSPSSNSSAFTQWRN